MSTVTLAMPGRPSRAGRAGRPGRTPAARLTTFMTVDRVEFTGTWSQPVRKEPRAAWRKPPPPPAARTGCRVSGGARPPRGRPARGRHGSPPQRPQRSYRTLQRAHRRGWKAGRDASGVTASDTAADLTSPG